MRFSSDTILPIDLIVKKTPIAIIGVFGILLTFLKVELGLDDVGFVIVEKKWKKST